MNVRHLLLAGLVLLLVSPLSGLAQDAATLVVDGKQAFREGRYEEAARAFERATEQDADNAEAHYLLARIYYETPLKDEDKAEDALDRAIDLDPDNVVYLVAKLQQLREDTWNFFSERLREMRRIDLSKKILELDPDNAFAHEELGNVYIRDFWRYRNAIMMPLYALEFAGLDGAAESPDLEAQNVGVIEGGSPVGADVRDLGRFEDPSRVFLNDQFDVETLQAQGIPIQDLSKRAQRAYEQAIDHLKHALETDPRRRPVYKDLMEIYALKGEYREALDMLQDMYRFFPEDPATWTYLGLAHLRLGSLEAADRSFETAFEYMDAAEEEAYQDIAFLLSDSEQKQYEQDPVAYRARYWTSKDPRYLTTYNERRLEHFARLTYADLLYGAPDLDLRGWETQRGLILVRYGLPESDVTITPNDESYKSGRSVVEAALYLPAENEDEIVGAQIRQNAAQLDEMMDTRLFDEMNTFNIWDYGDFRFVFEDPSRNGDYRLYSPPATAIAQGQDAWINDYQIRAKETFRETPEQYDYSAPGRQIELPYLTSAFKGEGEQTDLYVHYGVPINEYDASQNMLEVTANTGTFLVSDQRDILVERRNTIYGLPTAQIVSFSDVNLWVDTQMMQSPPGTHELSVEFETASGNTVAVQRREVEVPGFEDDRFSLSDLLLAYRVEESFDGEPLGPSEIVRDGLSIQPAPWSVFRLDQPVYVYFEAYTLDRTPEGQTDYTVDVVLVPKDDASGISKLFKNLFGGDKGVSFSFPGTSTSPDISNYQIIDVSDQEPGVYTLAVRVRDNTTGQTVESEQDLFLEE